MQIRLQTEYFNDKGVFHIIWVQYKKVASLMIISLAIEHTDLMSNVEQGMSNYEVMFLFYLAVPMLVTKIEIN